MLLFWACIVMVHMMRCRIIVPVRWSTSLGVVKCDDDDDDDDDTWTIWLCMCSYFACLCSCCKTIVWYTSNNSSTTSIGASGACLGGTVPLPCIRIRNRNRNHNNHRDTTVVPSCMYGTNPKIDVIPVVFVLYTPPQQPAILSPLQPQQQPYHGRE